MLILYVFYKSIFEFRPTFDLLQVKLQHNSIPKPQELMKITCDNETEFECQDDTKRCIPREWVLDNQPDCADSSDEKFLVM